MKKSTHAIPALVLALFFILAMLPITVSADDANVALNKTYTVSAEASMDNAFPNLSYSDPNSELTDGKKGDVNNIGKNWIQFYRGLSYSVVLDLGKEMYINKISVGFLNRNAYGIYYPRNIKYAVSVDGETFETIFEEHDATIMTDKDPRRVACTFEADSARVQLYYAARYVRLYFTCDVNAYIDEFEVIGIETKPENIVPFTADEPETFPNAYASNKKPILDGASNIVLIYNGEYYRGAIDKIGNHSSANLLPYAAYVDKSGNYSDTMFDSFLFLPLAPGDGCDGSFSSQKGWEIYLKNTIGAEENVNLTALDATIGEIKEKLQLADDYKVNIFLTVPTIPLANAVFGNLDGDTPIKTNNLENAKKVVKWYVDLCEKTFNDSNFKNLNLTGFYWWTELVRYSETTFDPELIKYFTEYCHSLDHAAIWIPYYGAPGFWEANELGFDVAALQSGYAFPREPDSETGNPQKGTCYDSMSIAKKYGLGVEIELSLVNDATERYTDYLVQSYLLGCMKDGVSMYYQAGGDGEFYRAAFSANSSVRRIYDMTYQYIKCTFSLAEPYMDYEGDISLIVDANNKRNKGNFPVENGDTIGANLQIDELNRPEHGDLSLEAKGFFFYTPDEGYIGEDSFSFSVTNGYYTSKLFTVHINVVDKALYCNGVNTALQNNRVVIYRDTEKSNSKEMAAFEIAVGADGTVISAGESSGIAIPEGGFVISTTGDKAEWAKNNVKVGQHVVYDEFTYNIAFLSANVSEESGDVESKPEVDSNASVSDVSSAEESGFPIVPVVAAVAAVVIIAIVAVVIIKKHKKE